MYCGNCGTEIKDNVAFCPNCGERIANVDVSTQKKPEANPKSLNLLLVFAGVIVFIVILFVFFSGGGGYKRTLNRYYRAYEKNDADLMYNSVVAQYWIDYMNEGWSDSAYETIQESIEDSIDHWDCGDKIKITYKIEDERRATKKELEGLEDNIYDWYAYYVYDRDDFSITDAYVLDIEFTVKGNEGTESFHYSDGLLIIKENGKWRIPRGSLRCSFYDNQ